MDRWQRNGSRYNSKRKGWAESKFLLKSVQQNAINQPIKSSAHLVAPSRIWGERAVLLAHPVYAISECGRSSWHAENCTEVSWQHRKRTFGRNNKTKRRTTNQVISSQNLCYVRKDTHVIVRNGAIDKNCIYPWLFVHYPKAAFL